MLSAAAVAGPTAAIREPGGRSTAGPNPASASTSTVADELITSQSKPAVRAARKLSSGNAS